RVEEDLGLHLRQVVGQRRDRSADGAEGRSEPERGPVGPGVQGDRRLRAGAPDHDDPPIRHVDRGDDHVVAPVTGQNICETLENLLSTVPPSDVTAAMQTRAMSASRSAYSTRLAPRSSLRRRKKLVRMAMATLHSCPLSGASVGWTVHPRVVSTCPTGGCIG